MNSNELEKFLRRINSTQVHYIGAPGYGRHSADFVEGSKTYCMGGTSIMKGASVILLIVAEYKNEYLEIPNKFEQ